MKTQYQKGETKLENVSQTRKYYDGRKWRRFCSVNQCNKIVQVQYLCARHFRERLNQQRLPSRILLPTFNVIDEDNSNSEETEDLEQTILANNEIPISVNNNISATNQTNCIASTITVIPADTSSNAISKNLMDCQYKLPSTNSYHCRKLSMYECLHGPDSFCLEHGFKHQGNLKEEIRCLLSTAQKLFNKIQKLKVIDNEIPCMKAIDQWATTMHTKINQTHRELKMKLDKYNGKIKKHKEHWRISLETQLEQNVGCILTEQLQNYEIDVPQVEKASREFYRLQKLFDSFNNQQLITLINDVDNRINLNPPVIVCANPLFNETSSPEEIKDNPDMSTANNEKFEIIKETNTQNTQSTIENLSEKIFDENITDSEFIDLIFNDEIYSSSNALPEQTSLNDLESATTTPSPHYRSSLQKFYALDQGDRTVDLSRNKATVQDMEHEVHHALQSDELNQPPIMFDLSCSRIGEKELSELYNTLEMNTSLKILNLNTNQIDDKGAEYLSHFLEKNTTLTHLDISRNQIGYLGMQYLSNALKKNKTLTILNLDHNQIEAKGVRYLSEALYENNTLTTLKLNSCLVENEGAQYLRDALKINTAITTLELAANRIDETGALFLRSALQSNSTLTTLDLRDNQTRETGTFFLSDALRTNKTLTNLNLERNQMPDTGVYHLCTALQENTTLTTLNLSYNLIKKIGAQHLSDVLQVNRTLTSLDLSHNEIKSTGARLISFMIRNNKTLTELNLQHNRIGEQGIRCLNNAIQENKTLIQLSFQ